MSQRMMSKGVLPRPAGGLAKRASMGLEWLAPEAAPAIAAEDREVRASEARPARGRRTVQRLLDGAGHGGAYDVSQATRR